MKKILLFLFAVSSAFAASQSRTHDGFFLNLNLGMGFQNIGFVVDDNQPVTTDKSGAATDIDIKIGGRIMENLLLHATLAGTTLTETFKGYDSDSYKIKEIKANMSLFGIGATYYFVDNFMATVSLGISQFHANEDVATFHAVLKNNGSQDENAGFGFQIGGGKEWWVSDEWGIGASISVLYGFASNLADTRESSFAISLRLSATYN
jgi:hypothetical protein